MLLEHLQLQLRARNSATYRRQAVLPREDLAARPGAPRGWGSAHCAAGICSAPAFVLQHTYAADFVDVFEHRGAEVSEGARRLAVLALPPAVPLCPLGCCHTTTCHQ